MKSKVSDLLSANEILLKTLYEHNIRLSDVMLLPAYKRFVELRKSEGGKMTYSVVKVAYEFGINERTMWRVIKKFNESTDIDGFNDK